jgi:carbohydrate-selective porin OprB
MKTISKLKKELDKWFSLYIRLRDADDLGFVKCYTSGRYYHYKNIHAGHFMSRKSHSTRWDEVNVQPQSIADNLFAQGRQYQFGVNLDAQYGEGTAESLQQKAREIKKFSRVDYEKKITYYKDLVNKLKKEKGIE